VSDGERKPTVVSRMLDLAQEACAGNGKPATLTNVGSCLMALSAMIAREQGMDSAAFARLATTVYQKTAGSRRGP